jgi:hypothetical protein
VQLCCVHAVCSNCELIGAPCNMIMHQGRRQGGGLKPPPPKRGMGAHARGVAGGVWLVFEEFEEVYGVKWEKGRQYSGQPPPPKLISPYALVMHANAI